MSVKALVVDDYEPSAKMLRWAMEEAKFEVKTASNAIDALKTLENFTPDIALLDITMTGMDGYTLCDVMRSDPKLHHTLFIAQTGWKTEKRKQQSRVAGFHHHLVKPVDLMLLFKIIEQHPVFTSSAYYLEPRQS